MILLYVALGSALGGVLRYLVGAAVQRPGHYPVGTLLVNVAGSFMLGLVLRLATETTAVTPQARAFLAVGLCGGFTTFSTFSWEVLSLAEHGAWFRAGGYALASVILSLAACIAGMALARQLGEGLLS
ncbi:MAG: fluoride efflux transporter CrcB [Gemmatimonadales bacterium]|jgi:CrcB protein|nr:fluoride efflux transporter CrcB [Gemmatimonadales bacterium]